MALHHNTHDSMQYFRHYINPLLDSLYPVPQEPNTVVNVSPDDPDDSNNVNDEGNDGVSVPVGQSGLSGENSDNLDHFEDTAPLCSPDLDTGSDILLFNNILLYHDMLFYWEFRLSIKDSDIGRTFEVIKHPLSQWLRVWFFGAGATNYGQELLHQALDLWFHFTEKMKNAVFNNYVISPSGRGNGCEQDLLQEHTNFWLKQFLMDAWPSLIPASCTKLSR
ncbi:uncharacterized protein EI90DRAFT_3018113 [Cantharellus anzutake]|uniref:uncharacterized protein n=1 Tax=Cantharellus anzutake TaxID=1750568 RepID=UPI00190317CE|nr:uncharacterized protein EI90DRAFT_3018113 [Cantharellus anzutake]KAF8327625.1 hypothetical protein EI90DRAFT_3018113 [Cantharellus anzutake]